MFQIVSESVTTSGWWDVATAIGTIAAAITSVFAAVAALWLGNEARKSAERANKAQIDAAEERLRLDHEASFHARRREHEVDLLLKLNEHINAFMHAGSGQEKEAITSNGLAVLLALPNTSGLICTKHVFASHVDFEDGDPPLEDAYPELNGEHPVTILKRGLYETGNRIRAAVGE